MRIIWFAELTSKRMVLLKQMVPGLYRVAMLWNAADLGMTLRYRASQAGAQAMGLSVQPLGVRELDDFEQAFAAMKREHDAFPPLASRVIPLGGTR